MIPNPFVQNPNNDVQSWADVAAECLIAMGLCFGIIAVGVSLYPIRAHPDLLEADPDFYTKVSAALIENEEYIAKNACTLSLAFFGGAILFMAASRRSRILVIDPDAIVHHEVGRVLYRGS